MNRVLTTAVLLVLTGAAYGDEHTADANPHVFGASENLNATDLIGARVYATDIAIDPAIKVSLDARTGWDDIGEINEIVFTRDGSVQSVILGAGGFLGLGEKDVALDLSQLSIIEVDGSDGGYFLVLNTSVDGISESPAYDRKAAGESDDAIDVAPMDTAAQLSPPSIEREGYATVQVGDLTSDDLTGARVYSRDDDDVGEIDTLLLGDDAEISRVVVDIGGFLGVGERRIAIGLNALQITRGTDGDVRVYINSTQEALEKMPIFDQ